MTVNILHLLTGGALLALLKKKEEPAPAPKPVDQVPQDVQYYLTSRSVLKARDLMDQGMPAEDASQLAASDVVDEYFGGRNLPY
jgi:hypothetical protein